jgi:2-polyprenyl-3-methyl-5-hydroxy-6-metoxy-1,4-benzoquinol methylase
MTIDKQTIEEQYGLVFEIADVHGISQLGLMSNVSWNQDPKRLLFTLSRYKFVAKMLEGSQEVLEIGCADAFGTRLVQQAVGHVTAIDIDPVFIEDAQKRINPHWPVDLAVHDLLSGPPLGLYDAIYSLDVLEHINPEQEDTFISNMIKPLNPNGCVVVGMPSLESQVYASPQSKAGHVNCKTGMSLKNLLQKYFANVFLFSMNDEVVHTGYTPMAHYLLVLCCGRKQY